jgi:hypothetical protein
VAEYRAKHSADISTGGIEWKVRAVSPDLLVANWDLIPTKEKIAELREEVAENKGASEILSNERVGETFKQLNGLFDVFLPAGVVDPKITSVESEASKDKFYTREILLEDRIALFEKIMELSGFSEDAEDKRKKSLNPQ